MVCTAFGLKIYRNDGGTSLTDVTASLHLAHYPGDAQMVHMNGDGKLDILVVSREGALSVFRNISAIGNLGANAFATRSDFSSSRPTRRR